ncbi:MAG: DEAD/DEAH box helicase family protein, partial [Actinomycetota bacterium]|nr:DEAD/DEAH box helicase family protein [Actinomycetota bacterium]
DRLSERFDAAGFRALGDVAARQDELAHLLAELSGFGSATAVLLATVASVVSDQLDDRLGGARWRHADLAGSAYPRPYQREAQAIFKGFGYGGQVIEAPTGSGKTMIGMLCIQDWLRSLAEGQSILVLVPTVSYQQQWLGELCHKPLGLRLAPHLVATGTPSSIETTQRRTGITPCIMIMTYAALAQLGSGVGKGGFDRDSIEIFLQGGNVQYVIFDEVHKVVEDLRGVSADVTRVLTEWVQDKSLRGAVGFSGTAAPYRSRFAALGLQLVHVMPAAELIAYGFVAPFAEFAVPFAYSDREQRVRDLLDAYKDGMHGFIALVGSERLRALFAEVPLAERVGMARNLFNSYSGSTDRDGTLGARLKKWERGGDISLTELTLVAMVQMAHGWSDMDLLRAGSGAPTAEAQWETLVGQLQQIRAELATLVYLPTTVERLRRPGFSTTLDVSAIEQARGATSAAAVRAQAADALSTTICGLYLGIRDWYQRVGEGRVSTIKSIIGAERAVRPVHGVIVFDEGTRMPRRHGAAVPGYRGVPGLFAEMLGDPELRPFAVLSNEMYLPAGQDEPLTGLIADRIRSTIIRGELRDALLASVAVDTGLDPGDVESIAGWLDELLTGDLVTTPPGGGRGVAGAVLAPLARRIRSARLGAPGLLAASRLSTRHQYVRDWSATVRQYLAICSAFDTAVPAELEQVSGRRQPFYAIRMGQGDRKQLMYDLTARIVDDPTLELNAVLVSSWARTGWNVITPNLLIDATATRDVIAWQQLRGRAMRAKRTWSNACHQLVLLLLSDPSHIEGSARSGSEMAERPHLSEDMVGLLTELASGSGGSAHTASALLGSGDVAALPKKEREDLVIDLMLSRNKVTHIYELIKAYGAGAQVRFDRTERSWQRIPSIEEKHQREFSVNPFSGTYGAGPAHAPMVFQGDPRKDVPAELRAGLTEQLQGRDDTILRGWLQGISSGEAENLAAD